MKKTFIVFLTSFLLGVFFSLFIGNVYNWAMWKTSEKLSFFENQKLDLNDFWEVYDIIEKQYFSDSQVKKETLVRGAISGMVDALWDKHSEFMDPETTEKFEETLTWDFEWIWAVVEKVPLWIKVERILKWSPAKKYGVRANDIIFKANDVFLDELDLFDAVEEIKWPAGTQVILSIIRPEEDSSLEIAVTREKIHIPSVEQEYYEDEKIAYIAINMYGEQTAQEFKEALDDVKKLDISGLIIDVRDNGGWYLLSAVEILSEFIEKDEILVKTRYKESFFNENYFSVNQGDIFDKKIVVLINGNSASASEITAGALKDHDKAILVWKKTYGKWSVQQPFDMQDGSLLKITVAKWFTPKWVNIDEEGISPDVEILFVEEDYENNYDRQLEEAKKILKLYIEKWTRWLTLDEYNK